MANLLKCSGIYLIENQSNGKKYVGSSNNMSKRKDNHFYALRNGVHMNKHLQTSFNKYGEENFKFTWIEHCQAINKNYLFSKEKYWINELDLTDPKKGYNKNPEPGKPYKMPIDVIRKIQKERVYNTKKIYVYNKTTLELVTTYPSAKEAATAYNTNDTKVRNNIRGDVPSVKGVIFCYEGQVPQKIRGSGASGHKEDSKKFAFGNVDLSKSFCYRKLVALVRSNCTLYKQSS